MLDFETTLHLEEREKVIEQRIERYFEQQGYHTRHDRGSVYYERGSAWGNYVAMSPSQWHVLATIALRSTDNQALSVDVRLEVDTTGQIVLDRERKYWETAFDVLTDYLETGKSKHEDIVGNLGQRNLRQNINLTIGISIVIGIATFLIINAVMFHP